MPSNPSKSSRSSSRSGTPKSASEPAGKKSTNATPAKAAPTKATAAGAKATPGNAAKTPGKTAPAKTAPAGSSTSPAKTPKAPRATTPPAKGPKSSNAYKDRKMVGRKALATIAGRALIRQDFHDMLKEKDKAALIKAAKDHAESTMSDDDAEVLVTIDGAEWAEIDAKVAELRALLPKVRNKTDAAGW